MAQLDHDFTRLQRQPYQQLNVALRAREFDRRVRAFLTQHPDGTVVDIGCGLDTRFERTDNGRVQWFNLDLPDVIALREQFFPPTPRCQNLTSSALNFGWMETVAETGGPYLFLAEVKQLMLALRDRFPGSEFVFDTIQSLMTCLSRLHPAIRQTRAARTRWGLDDSRVPERWRTGLRLLSDWRYYAHDEPRLGWYKWLRYVPFVHDFRVLRYRLGDKNPCHD